MRKKESVKVIPLGGMGEIGKNMYIIEYANEMVIIDAGVKFGDADSFGADLVIPDISYIEEHAEKIKGLFITHGHEDHIGGIPFLLKKINVPIFAGKLALGFIKSKLQEHGLFQKVELNEISDDTEVDFCHISASFFRTTHSIPDSFGVVINTPLGKIACTGDFKFDLSPNGPHSNLSKISEIGQGGVLCLLSDSTNSEVPGFSMSEKQISNNIFDIFQQQTGRVIISLFASNIYRVQQIIEASIASGRKVAIIGRSMERAIFIGQELGYIKADSEVFITPAEIKSYKDNDITIICTGSQGEPFAALSRIANGKHRYISVENGDTIIFSSSPIPGNELNVNKVINKLMKAGAKIIDNQLYDIHTSGHGGQEELKLMLHLMKPKYLVPVHGEFRMQRMHQTLAMECKIPKENIFVLDNGDILNISSEGASFDGKVPAGSVFVKGNHIISLNQNVINERRRLSKNGIISIFFLKKENMLIDIPQVFSRGFVYMKEAQSFVADLQTFSTSLFYNSVNDLGIEYKIKKSISSYIYTQLKRRPIVIVKLIDIKI
ncbi:ribonuclease J [Virgibacillus soli]|nr:ribonuclease J [Virgibacillus soli]